MDENVDILLENRSLKEEFKMRGLDLTQVFVPTPEDLELENRRLSHLLDWVNKYNECGSRVFMEAQGYEFPPIDPDFSPDNDWFIFERWLQGKPTSMKLKDQLPPGFVIKKPDELKDKEVFAEIQKLCEALGKIRIAIDMKEGVPYRLVYMDVLDALEEKFGLLCEGAFHLDGCSGVCPECYQRPWCEFGINSCWPEDEEAGEMYLIDAVKEYLCPCPMSLEILQKVQAEQDKKAKEFEKKYEELSEDFDPADFFNDDVDEGENDIPF